MFEEGGGIYMPALFLYQTNTLLKGGRFFMVTSEVTSEEISYLLPYAVTFVNGEQGHVLDGYTANSNFVSVQRLCSERATLVSTFGLSPYRISQRHRTFCILPNYHPVHEQQKR
jgi:hypothetical protein